MTAMGSAFGLSRLQTCRGACCEDVYLSFSSVTRLEMLFLMPRDLVSLRNVLRAYSLSKAHFSLLSALQLKALPGCSDRCGLKGSSIDALWWGDVRRDQAKRYVRAGSERSRRFGRPFAAKADRAQRPETPLRARVNSPDARLRRVASRGDGAWVPTEGHCWFVKRGPAQLDTGFEANSRPAPFVECV